MSFTGDLEHLPIVDVIQLLHATRKSGVLRVKSRKGESHLVFKNGYMVSANHLNNSVRIGQVLVDLKIISPESLDQALLAQKQAGHGRKPLVVTLMENGHAKEADLYKGLEQLIEMTLVEILTWKKGTFILDVGPPPVADEYCYYPEKMNLEINVDAQSMLMDALRVYDEKIRDGLLVEEDFPEDEQAGGAQESQLISAEDLGLADLDQLEAKIPEVFTTLEDPCKFHRVKIAEIAPSLSAAEKEELVRYFAKRATGGKEPIGVHESAQPLVFFSADQFLAYAVTTACNPAGILVFVTEGEEDLQQIITRSLEKNRTPLLMFDAPEKCGAGHTAETIKSLRQQLLLRYPDVAAIQLASPGAAEFTLQAYADGIRAVMPRPLREKQEKTFAADAIHLLNALEVYARGYFAERQNSQVSRLQKEILRLQEVTEASEAAHILLEAVGDIFERSLTLIVKEKELVAEKGAGLQGDKSEGIRRTTGFRIPLANPSLFTSLIEGGSHHYGATEDELVRQHLFSAIGAPCSSMLLLLPMRCRGKTLSLTYGDFGAKEPSPVATDLLEILARQAGLVLENSLHRKKSGKTAQ